MVDKMMKALRDGVKNGMANAFYPATTHAYNAGYDDGFFGNEQTRLNRTKSEAEAYQRGFQTGVECRPKKVKKEKVK